jgi:hypothetical protein
VQLWEVGVLTWDAACKKEFRMKRMLILTLADYPAHGMILGQVTRDFMGCTIYGKIWIKIGPKHYNAASI